MWITSKMRLVMSDCWLSRHESCLKRPALVFTVVPFYSQPGRKALSNRRLGCVVGISAKDNLTGSDVSVSEMALEISFTFVTVLSYLISFSFQQRIEIHKLRQGDNLILGFSIGGGIDQDPTQNPFSEDKTDKVR